MTGNENIENVGLFKYEIMMMMMMILIRL